MNNIVDNAIILRILFLLAQKVTNTEAYKLGIVDERGHPLKDVKDLKTDKEKNAYSYLQRFIFKIKAIMNKVGVVPTAAFVMTLLKEDIAIEDINENVVNRKLKMMAEEGIPSTSVANVSGLQTEPFKGNKSPSVLPMVRRNLKTKLKGLDDGLANSN